MTVEKTTISCLGQASRLTLGLQFGVLTDGGPAPFDKRPTIAP